jgi:cytochrome c oxidase subunit 3
MSEGITVLKEPYSGEEQQRQAAMMGMYIFLSSEVMLFGGIFTVAAIMHMTHAADFVKASKAMHYWIGGINTAVLLTSSLFVALGVEAAKLGSCSTRGWLGAAAGLGVVFLGFKAYEYSVEFSEGLLPVPGVHSHFETPTQHLFMNLYLIATGLHAFHLTVGIVLMTTLALRAGTKGIGLPQRAIVVVAGGLYWHIVDIVWVFLYPVMYLAR